MSLTWDFQTIESFDVITDSTGTHAALNAVHGPVPPNADTGDARWSFSSTGYTLNSPGLYGIGQSISRPNAVTFTFENGTSHPGVRVRFAFKVSAFTGTRVLCKSGALQMEVTSGGLLQRNNTTTGSVVTSSGSAISTGVVHVLEFAFYSSTTDGAYRIHLDGVEDTSLSANGLNTKGAGSNPGTVVFNETNATFDLFIDNMRCDASDSALSGAFDSGDMMTSPTVVPRMATVVPTAQGNYANFGQCGDHATADPFCLVSGGASSTNYTFVNDVPSDEKKSFLQSSTANQRESWACGNLPAEVGTIYMVQTDMAVWGDGASRDDFHFLRIGGTDYDHAQNANFEFIGVGAQIGWTCRMWATNPATSGAWSPSDFPLECGQKCTAGGAPLGVTQVAIIIDYLAVQAASPDSGLYTLAQTGVDW